MNEHDPTPDPTATFRLDQQEAAAEAATRDQTAWEQHVQDTEANLAMKRAHTLRTLAQANIMEALSLAIYSALILGTLWLAVVAIQGIVGWFQ